MKHFYLYSLHKYERAEYEYVAIYTDEYPLDGEDWNYYCLKDPAMTMGLIRKFVGMFNDTTINSVVVSSLEDSYFIFLINMAFREQQKGKGTTLFDLNYITPQTYPEFIGENILIFHPYIISGRELKRIVDSLPEHKNLFLGTIASPDNIDPLLIKKKEVKILRKGVSPLFPPPLHFKAFYTLNGHYYKRL